LLAKAKLYVPKKTSFACFQRFSEPLSVNKAKLYLQVIKTKFLLAKGKEAWLVFLGAYFAPLLIF